MEGGSAIAEPRRIPLPLLLALFAVFVVCGYVADATWPTLVNSHPLTLLALSAKNRYLILTAPQLSIVPFFVVGFIRLVATDPIGFVLGRQYGPAAIQWIESKTSEKTHGDSFIRRLEAMFSKASVVFIVVAPSVMWCMMAGASRMKVWLFLTCNFVGTVGRLALFWWLGDAFESPIDSVLGTVQDYQLPLLGLTLSLGIIQVIHSRRRGELETPAEMEASLEAELADQS